jgi:hypothetical protein
MRKIVGLLAPIALTAVLFLVLYNNSDRGCLILLLLLAMNLGILFISRGSRAAASAMIAPAKFASVCVIGVLFGVLVIETLFPLVLPREYAGIKELTKGFTESAVAERSDSVLVFAGSEQRQRPSLESAERRAQVPVRWHAPGAEFVYYGYEPNLKVNYINRFRWNSQGYFDRDHKTTKPHNVKRVVVIGDSYVEAVQVPLAKSFHKLLEAALNSSYQESGELKFEVIALGNSGTGQIQNFEVLRNQALAYSPDAVVMTLCSNDFCDDDPALKRELVLASGQITPPIRGAAAHGYFAVAFALRRIDDIQRNRLGISPELLQWSASEIPRVETAWERTLDKVRESRDFCTERGIMFTLVYLGSDLEVKYAADPSVTVAGLKAMGGPHQTISWDMSRSVRRVDEYCKQHHILLISLLEPLVEAQKETGKLVFGDHYSMFGHQVVAHVLNCTLNLRWIPHAAERASLKQCSFSGSWRAVAAAEGLSSPSDSSAPTFVPASGPATQAK